MGFGVGLFSDLDRAAVKWIEMGSRTQTQPANAAFYRERIQRYTALMEAINRISEQ